MQGTSVILEMLQHQQEQQGYSYNLRITKVLNCLMPNFPTVVRIFIPCCCNHTHTMAYLTSFSVWYLFYKRLAKLFEHISLLQFTSSLKHSMKKIILHSVLLFFLFASSTVFAEDHTPNLKHFDSEQLYNVLELEANMRGRERGTAHILSVRSLVQGRPLWLTSGRFWVADSWIWDSRHYHSEAVRSQHQLNSYKRLDLLVFHCMVLHWIRIGFA